MPYNFKKSLGQHFLFDKNIINMILDTAGIRPEDVVVEIGPGPGIMTRIIGERVRRLIAIEIDNSLADILRKDLSEQQNIEIINADALDYRFEELEKGFKVIANLPYYITTPILFRMMEVRDLIESMTLMVQKEVAERITAMPGGKEYGILSILIQYYSRPEIAFIVPRGSFRPAPKVDSALLHLKILPDPRIKVNDESFFFRIVRLSFSQRRKTLQNCLKGLGLKKEVLGNAFSSLGIDPKRRAETLSIEEFGLVADELYNIQSNSSGNYMESR